MERIVSKRKKLLKMVSRVFILVLLSASLFAGRHVVSATESTIKIYIGDSRTARHHMAITQGEFSDEYSFSVKDHEVKSSSYASSNPASFQIVPLGEGRCKVKAVSEGTGLVTLTVKTTDGKSLTEKVFVSVYKKVTACRAEALKKTDVYRGASSSAGVENADKKGTLSKGEAVTIAPSLATEKAVIWKTGSSKTASVNAAGTVNAKAEGTTTVSATAKDGSGKSDSVYLSVYKKVTETSGYLKSDTDFYAVGNDKVSIGKGK